MTVVNGQEVIPNVSFSLAQGGALAGRVTDGEGAGISDIVVVEDATGNRVLGTISAQTGYFFVSSLPPGDYFLRVERGGTSIYYGQADYRADADRNPKKTMGLLSCQLPHGYQLTLTPAWM